MRRSNKIHISLRILNITRITIVIWRTRYHHSRNPFLHVDSRFTGRHSRAEYIVRMRFKCSYRHRRSVWVLIIKLCARYYITYIPRNSFSTGVHFSREKVANRTYCTNEIQMSLQMSNTHARLTIITIIIRRAILQSAHTPEIHVQPRLAFYEQNTENTRNDSGVFRRQQFLPRVAAANPRNSFYLDLYILINKMSEWLHCDTSTHAPLNIMIARYFVYNIWKNSLLSAICFHQTWLDSIYYGWLCITAARFRVVTRRDSNKCRDRIISCTMPTDTKN